MPLESILSPLECPRNALCPQSRLITRPTHKTKISGILEPFYHHLLRTVKTQNSLLSPHSIARSISPRNCYLPEGLTTASRGGRWGAGRGGGCTQAQSGARRRVPLRPHAGAIRRRGRYGRGQWMLRPRVWRNHGQLADTPLCAMCYVRRRYGA